MEVVATDYVTFTILEMSSSVEGRAQRILKLYSKPLPPGWSGGWTLLGQAQLSPCS